MIWDYNINGIKINYAKMHPAIKTLGTSYQETVPTLVSVI